MKRLGPEGGVLAHRLFLEGGSFVNLNPASFSWLKPPPLAALPAGSEASGTVPPEDLLRRDDETHRPQQGCW